MSALLEIPPVAVIEPTTSGENTVAVTTPVDQSATVKAGGRAKAAAMKTSPKLPKWTIQMPTADVIGKMADEYQSHVVPAAETVLKSLGAGVTAQIAALSTAGGGRISSIPVPWRPSEVGESFRIPVSGLVRDAVVKANADTSSLTKYQLDEVILSCAQTLLSQKLPGEILILVKTSLERRAATQASISSTH